MSANIEKCAGKDKSECDYNEFRRLKYFHGMLLDDKDFQAEQQYHSGKRRFLNRMLHGSGVVCGLELRGEKGKRWLEVTPGVALDCSGNEIWVPKNFRIDIASLLPSKPKGKGNDKCRPVDEEDDLRTYYIGIRYDEKPTNPVSVYLPSGSCEERSCENSRWKEGYCVEIVECCYEPEPDGLIQTLCMCLDKKPLDPNRFKDLCGKCPTPETDDPALTEEQKAERTQEWCECMVFQEFCERSVPCAECCSCEKSCHVILGQIKINPDTCVLEKVCMNECRRYVLTGRLIQQLLSRIFSGSEKRLQVGGEILELKDGEKFSEYIYNPIKALCWLLPALLKGGKFQLLDCENKAPEPSPDARFILEEVRKVERTLNEGITALRTENRALSDRVTKLEPPPIN